MDVSVCKQHKFNAKDLRASSFSVIERTNNIASRTFLERRGMEERNGSFSMHKNISTSRKVPSSGVIELVQLAKSGEENLHSFAAFDTYVLVPELLNLANGKII